MNIDSRPDALLTLATNYALTLMVEGKTQAEATDHAFQRFGVKQDAISGEFLRRMNARGVAPEVGVASTPSSACSPTGYPAR